MPKLYAASAAVVKVAVGPVTGNRVARIIKRGGIIPEGVDPAKLEKLEELGLIVLLADPEEDARLLAEAEAQATADAEAKAAAAEARAKTAAEKKAKAEADAAAAAAGK
ncbi:hypothetical protein [Arthrobacter sp. MP_2.3]|uniref:hypothetical protein n=1 Tax=Arthrobacter sp. MP_2.3 TaxID=3349633 RepID=UPI0038D45C50